MLFRSASDFWTGFEGEFESYKPKKSVIYELFAIIQKQHIKVNVIGGNWCSDTKTQVPRLCKVLHLAGLSEADFSYVQVDRSKNQILAPGELERTDDKPSKVPTVYISKDGKIIGTIIETPTKSWEADILKVLQ